MHEATITIKKLWPPYSPGDKRTTLEDTDGNKYRLEVVTGAGFHDNDVVDIGWTEEKTDAKFGGKEYKLIKKMKLVTPPPFKVNGQTPVTSGDAGPHLGMWEREVFGALLSGKTGSEIRLLAIEARQLAREILKTNLDGKLPPAPAEFNDDLETPIEHF